MKKKYSSLPTTEKTAALLHFVQDHKGQNPVVLNLSQHNAFAEAMLIVTATSVRHAQSLAEGISTFCKEQNFEFLRMEGKQTGQWILLDLNDVVVNIFQESVRDLYKLESLWSDATPAAIHMNPSQEKDQEF